MLNLQGDIQLTYDRIEAGTFDIPEFVSPEAKHLVRLVCCLSSPNTR